MQLSFMWMLKHLLLEERQQWQEGPETTRPHHPQPDKKKGFQSCNCLPIANHFSQVGGSNSRPLAAAALSRDDKTNKYATDCSKPNLAFHPLVMDAYDGIPLNTVHYALSPLISRRTKNFVPQNWAAPT